MTEFGPEKPSSQLFRGKLACDERFLVPRVECGKQGAERHTIHERSRFRVGRNVCLPFVPRVSPCFGETHTMHARGGFRGTHLFAEGVAPHVDAEVLLLVDGRLFSHRFASAASREAKSTSRKATRCKIPRVSRSRPLLASRNRQHTAARVCPARASRTRQPPCAPSGCLPNVYASVSRVPTNIMANYN